MSLVLMKILCSSIIFALLHLLFKKITREKELREQAIPCQKNCGVLLDGLQAQCEFLQKDLEHYKRESETANYNVFAANQQIITLRQNNKQLEDLRKNEQTTIRYLCEEKRKLQVTLDKQIEIYKEYSGLRSINLALNNKLDVLEKDEAMLQSELADLHGELAKTKEVSVVIETTLNADIAKYRKKYKAIKSSLCCVVCFEDTRSRIAYSCGHTAVCRDCDKHIQKCPICQAAIVMRLNVILP